MSCVNVKKDPGKDKHQVEKSEGRPNYLAIIVFIHLFGCLFVFLLKVPPSFICPSSHSPHPTPTLPSILWPRVTAYRKSLYHQGKTLVHLTKSLVHPPNEREISQHLTYFNMHMNLIRGFVKMRILIQVLGGDGDAASLTSPRWCWCYLSMDRNLSSKGKRLWVSSPYSMHVAAG